MSLDVPTIAPGEEMGGGGKTTLVLNTCIELKVWSVL
jgi:hypothetical protein